MSARAFICAEVASTTRRLSQNRTTAPRRGSICKDPRCFSRRRSWCRFGAILPPDGCGQARVSTVTTCPFAGILADGWGCQREPAACSRELDRWRLMVQKTSLVHRSPPSSRQRAWCSMELAPAPTLSTNRCLGTIRVDAVLTSACLDDFCAASPRPHSPMARLERLSTSGSCWGKRPRASSNLRVPRGTTSSGSSFIAPGTGASSSLWTPPSLHAIR